MFKILIILFTLSLYSLRGTTQNNKQLQISLYYEYLCPYSTKFIVKQLYPVFDEIENYINITYVPFGKAESVNNGEHFFCQHGEPECKGNKLQSCALHLLDGNQRLQTEFVVCQMRFGNDPTGFNCSQNVRLDFNSVVDCYNSTKGTELQLEAEKITNQIRKPLQYVPTIVYNNVYHEELRQKSKKTFFSVVCDELTKLNNIPPACLNNV